VKLLLRAPSHFRCLSPSARAPAGLTRKPGRTSDGRDSSTSAKKTFADQAGPQRWQFTASSCLRTTTPSQNTRLIFWLPRAVGPGGSDNTSSKIPAENEERATQVWNDAPANQANFLPLVLRGRNVPRIFSLLVGAGKRTRFHLISLQMGADLFSSVQKDFSD